MDAPPMQRPMGASAERERHHASPQRQQQQHSQAASPNQEHHASPQGRQREQQQQQQQQQQRRGHALSAAERESARASMSLQKLLVREKEVQVQRQSQKQAQRELGDAARMRLDAASGAHEYVKGKYNSKAAYRHVVNKAHRRSIADAYAAVVTQVDGIPQDSYSLALHALDRAFNPKPPFSAPLSLDFNLGTSPFVTSRAKHHAIYHTAFEIMRKLDQVVHEVAPHLPGELDQLQNRPMTAPPAGPPGGSGKAAGAHGSKARPGTAHASARPTDGAADRAPPLPRRPRTAAAAATGGGGAVHRASAAAAPSDTGDGSLDSADPSSSSPPRAVRTPARRSTARAPMAPVPEGPGPAGSSTFPADRDVLGQVLRVPEHYRVAQYYDHHQNISPARRDRQARQRAHRLAHPRPAAATAGRDQSSRAEGAAEAAAADAKAAALEAAAAAHTSLGPAHPKTPASHPEERPRARLSSRSPPPPSSRVHKSYFVGPPPSPYPYMHHDQRLLQLARALDAVEGEHYSVGRYAEGRYGPVHMAQIAREREVLGGARVGGEGGEYGTGVEEGAGRLGRVARALELVEREQRAHRRRAGVQQEEEEKQEAGTGQAAEAGAEAGAGAATGAQQGGGEGEFEGPSRETALQILSLLDGAPLPPGLPLSDREWYVYAVAIAGGRSRRVHPLKEGEVHARYDGEIRAAHVHARYDEELADARRAYAWREGVREQRLQERRWLVEGDRVAAAAATAARGRGRSERLATVVVVPAGEGGGGE